MRGVGIVLAIMIVAAFHFSCTRDRARTLHAEGDVLDQLYQEYGRRAMDEGDYHTAISYFTKAIDEVGESFSSLKGRSDALRLLGDTESALKDIYSAFRHCIQEYHVNGEPLNLHSSAYCIFLIGDKDFGELILGLLQERHPDYAKSIKSSFGEKYFQVIGDETYQKGFKLLPE